VPSYASSDIDGLVVFYELLSLKEAIADELDADEQYRQELGPGFEAYLARQLEIVRSAYAAGLAWGTAYSAQAVEGEFGSYVLDGLRGLRRQEFQAARNSGWAATPSAGDGALHPLHLSFV
jgi:hypothetical protein